MEAVQKDHWYFVVLIFLPFLKVAVQQEKVVTVHLEEGMVLECLCPWQGELSLVSWTKIPDKDPIAVFHPEYGLASGRRYRDRIEFLRSKPMDGSISMRNVTHQDIGLYHCSIQTFPQGPWTSDIQVEDLDDPPEEEDSTEPPTPEVMETRTELVAEQSSNLTISFNHEHNGTVYQVILERMLPGQPWVIIGVCKTVEGGLVGEDYSDRGSVICVDTLDVSLHLTGVVQEDGGLYRCTFSTDTGAQTRTVLLTVPPPGGFSLTVYMMYIHIGAGAAGLILLVGVIIVAVRLSKKSNREENRVKLHPSQRQPNLYENVAVCLRKKSQQIRNSPIYSNIQTVRSQPHCCSLHNK